MKYYKIHLVEIKSNRKNYNLQRIRNQSYNVLEGGKDESEWRVARRRGRAPWTTNFSGKHRTYFLFCALSFECIIFVLLRKFPYGTQVIFSNPFVFSWPLSLSHVAACVQVAFFICRSVTAVFCPPWAGASQTVSCIESFLDVDASFCTIEAQHCCAFIFLQR